MGTNIFASSRAELEFEECPYCHQNTATQFEFVTAATGAWDIAKYSCLNCSRQYIQNIRERISRPILVRASADDGAYEYTEESEMWRTRLNYKVAENSKEVMIMSERGSFCTEYVYCDKCFDACRKVLLGDVKYLNSQEIKELPIIAGKIGGSWAGVELFDMEFEYIPAIQELMCDDHSLRICVHSDCRGSVIYEFTKYNVKTTEHKPYN